MVLKFTCLFYYISFRNEVCTPILYFNIKVKVKVIPYSKRA